MISNKDAYESLPVVQDYCAYSEIQKPEETILNELKDSLGSMRMLDIGVGGGRTTFYFAPLVREYIGIDYSENMINVCRERFRNSLNQILFDVCDVRDMKRFTDSYFDIILFSFNGLDYMNHDDRLKALSEIKRVGKSGGLFVFSSHNLQSIDPLFTVTFCFKPKRLAWRIVRYLLLRLLNSSPEKLKQQSHAIINDGAHNFKLKTYYIKPPEQISQLMEYGFNNIRVFSLETGEEIKTESDLQTINDRWIYYCTTIQKILC